MHLQDWRCSPSRSPTTQSANTAIDLELLEAGQDRFDSMMISMLLRQPLQPRPAPHPLHSPQARPLHSPQARQRLRDRRWRRLQRLNDSPSRQSTRSCHHHGYSIDTQTIFFAAIVRYKLEECGWGVGNKEEGGGTKRGVRVRNVKIYNLCEEMDASSSVSASFLSADYASNQVPASCSTIIICGKARRRLAGEELTKQRRGSKSTKAWDAAGGDGSNARWRSLFTFLRGFGWTGKKVSHQTHCHH